MHLFARTAFVSSAAFFLPATMINYAEYILRSYFKATDWNPDAQYSNLNRASAGGSQATQQAPP